jgi:hypothetical protein
MGVQIHANPKPPIGSRVESTLPAPGNRAGTHGGWAKERFPMGFRQLRKNRPPIPDRLRVQQAPVDAPFECPKAHRRQALLGGGALGT